MRGCCDGLQRSRRRAGPPDARRLDEPRRSRRRRCRRVSLPVGQYGDDAPLAAMADEARRFYARAVPSRGHAHAAGRADPRALRARDLRLRSALGAGQHHRGQRSRACASRSATGSVLLGLSGGVDSSVVAALLHRAIGEQLVCVFVDHGLLRLGEGDQVMDDASRDTWASTSCASMPRRVFSAALRGETDPETQAQDHRAAVHRGVRGGGAQAQRHSTGSRRARSIPT